MIQSINGFFLIYISNTRKKKFLQKFNFFSPEQKSKINLRSKSSRRSPNKILNFGEKKFISKMTVYDRSTTFSL